MNRLIQFIFSNRHFFLFLLLEFFTLSLLFRYSLYHQTLIAEASAEISGNVNKWVFNTKKYFRLKTVNDSLVSENARLRSRLSKLYSAYSLTQKADTQYNYRFVYYHAHVINNQTAFKHNYMTLSKGKNMGIQKNMGVVSPHGIVGIIVDVSPHFSRAISILNLDFSVNAKILENGEVGSVSWDGISPSFVNLDDIPVHIKVNEGDHVVVGPYSRIFPENYPIGIVERVKTVHGEAFHHIRVRLNERMKNLTHVYIIRNTLQNEIEQLESLLPDE